MTIRACVTACVCSAVFLGCAGLVAAQSPVGYKLLATSKTSTMEREMNGTAEAGFRFAGVMGGDTAAGGQEVVVIMAREGEAVNGRFQYKLLATSKTSTMQREMQAAGDAGYEYEGQTVFKSAFGGEEVVVILERDRQATPVLHEYRLLATSKTSTMERELDEAGRAGFRFVGMTVSKTAMGGSEVVVITRREKR
jgi:hypothetical protein